MRKINQRKAGALLSYVNLGLGCIVPLLYTPIMLRILGQEEYGLYGLANSVISYLSLLNFGMGSAIVRYVSKYRADGDTEGVRGIVGLFLLIYGALALVTCGVGVALAGKADVLFDQGLTATEIVRLRRLMLVMAASTAVSLPISVFSSIISAYEQFVFSKSYAIFGTILAPVMNLIVLYCGFASVGMAACGLVIQVVNGVVYMAFCAGRLHLMPSFRNMPFGLLKEIWVFSFFVFLSSIVDMLYWATDKVLIGAMVGSAAVAVYNVGGTFTAMLQGMSQAISNMFTPKVMMMARQGATAEETSRLMTRIGRLQFYIVSFLLSGYVVFGQRFILFWAGAGYEDAYYIALLTMVPLAVPLIQSIAYSTIVAQNRHQFRAIVYALIAVANVVSTWLVLPYYGIIGAAVCTAAAYTLGNGVIMNIFYSKKIGLDIGTFWKNIGRIGIVPGAAAAAGWYIMNVVLSGDSMKVFLAGVLVYSVVFWALSWFISMNRYEKDLFGGMARQLARIVRRK